MEKFISLTLAMVMLFALLMPTPSFALSTTQHNVLSVSFDNMTENTNISLNTTFTGMGTNANYTPVSVAGGNGKSLKIGRLSSTGKAAINISSNNNATKFPPSGGLSKGDMICINWNWAFADFNVERFVNATFFKTSQTQWNVTDSYSYDGSTKCEDILKLSPNGSIRFFGKTLNEGYYFDLNKWYNFEIRIKQGISTDTANDIAGEKAVAELYVDGLKIAEKAINNAADSSTTINQIFGLYSLSMGTPNMGKNGIADVTYVDDIQFGYYKQNANSEWFRYYTDINGKVKDLTLSSKSDNFIIDSLG